MKKTNFTRENDAGRPFPCFMCGECCSYYQASMTLLEAKGICGRLGLGWDDFVNRYTDSRWPGATSFLLIHKNGGCVFLKRLTGQPLGKCAIYPFKPLSCSDFSPGIDRKECKAGLKQHWKLDVDEQGHLTGQLADVKRFEKFLDGLKNNINKILA